MDGEQNIAIRIEGRGNTGSRLPINLSFNVLDLDAWLRNYLGTWKRVLSEMTGKADG
jgi:hypothetical protein